PAQRARERTGEAVVGQEPRLDARAHGSGLAVECLDHRRPRQAPADDVRRRGLSVPGAPAARRRGDPRGHGVGPELVDAHDVAPAAGRGDGSPVHADAIVARLLHGGGQRARRRLSRGRRPVRGGRRPDRGCCGVPDGNPDRVREGARARCGAHPAGMYGMNLPELEGYAEDPEFILELRRAFRQLETARGWIREWMLEVPDQAAYLAKLGYERIMEVKGRAHTDAWVSELEML